MRRVTLALVFCAPTLVMAWAAIWPEADPSAPAPIFHFYIVTFATFAAAVVFILLSAALERIARPRHMLAAVSFALMGLLFFSHGLPTPGALTTSFHPAVQWSAWLTLFVGGLVFLFASFDGAEQTPAWLKVRPFIGAVAGGALAYLAVAVFRPQWLSALDASAAPWHGRAVFYATLSLWLMASIQLGRTWLTSRIRVDGVLTFVAFWMAQATVSMHNFPLWNLSWWLYHFILLVATLVTILYLAAEYEQARRFRLLRYYVGVSLVVTAGLALVGSYLFATYAEEQTVADREDAAFQLVCSLIDTIGDDLPPSTTPAEIRSSVAEGITRQGFDAVLVFDTYGDVTFAAGAGEAASPAEPGEHHDYGSSGGAGPTAPQTPNLEFELDDISAALKGETLVEVYQPGDPPDFYRPDRPVHTVQVYAPLPLAEDLKPAGVLAVLEEAPELGLAILRARTIGLVAAALTMGALFCALLLVVLRADRIIAARTGELAGAYSELRRSESMREDLMLMTVHDLRNPLTAINTGLNLLSGKHGKADPARRQRFLENTGTAAKRMTALVDDILAVSKIEAGQLKPRLVAVNLSELLARRLDAFSAQAYVEQKRLSQVCPADLEVMADPELVGRVVDNIVGNAFKYTDTGGSIQVRASQQNGQVLIRVRDDGEGVPEADKECIFEKFVQGAEGNGRPVRAGTGLGLAFCRFVVEAHGGCIWVEDAPGGGSDFIFSLPGQSH